MGFMRWLISIVLIFTLLQSALAGETWAVDIGQARVKFEAVTGAPLRAGHRVESTVFPGYYAVRSGGPGEAAAYFREDMSWMGNVRSQGWTTSSISENSSEGQRRWLKDQVSHLPLDQLILVKRSKPPVAVIWSAPDCPFCRRLEKALEQEDVSVYVAPVGLSIDGYRRSAEIYCAMDSAKAWISAMHGSQVDSKQRPSCAYPRDMLGDIGFFVGRGRVVTPIVVFADGSTITGWDDEHALARLREKIAQKIFFPDS